MAPDISSSSTRHREGRAAIYVRMSSSPQDHSIQHQIDRLSAYADENGFTIIMMYADAGKSGLRINGRDGLQGLISDVQSGAAEFDTVLVYDVSRWGRFQDIDESAHYEFICRQAGVNVIYCAEHFIDDGSPMGALMKGVKRIMAAEYSRELGAKVLHAQCHFSQMGYKQGGHPGYGLRRVPISQDGKAKKPLETGERKPSATDRVVLRHGPPEEVAIVRRIYHLYTVDGWTDTRIARLLRSEGLLNQMGKPWDTCSVRRILINPRYCGEVVFNQTTRRLKAKVAANPMQAWVRCVDALEAMVDRATFDAAQTIRRERAEGPSEQAMLDRIRAIDKKHQRITEPLCRGHSVLRKDAITKRFGSFLGACAAAGLPARHTSSGALDNMSIRIRIQALSLEVEHRSREAGATVRHTSVWNVLSLNNTITVKVTLASNRSFSDGQRRWRVPISCGAKADYVLCGLLDETNEDILCYLLLATAAVSKASLLLSKKKLANYADYTFSALSELFAYPTPSTATQLSRLNTSR